MARAFGISGAARTDLKRLINELKDDGLIESRRKRLRKRGELPPVTVLAVNELDSNGDLFAVPVDWDQEADGAAPKVIIAIDPKRRPAPGIGDHVLARISKGEPRDGVAHTGRIIKILDRQPKDVLGIFRRFRDGGRIEPIDRKQKELFIESADTGRAVDGDLVSVVTIGGGRHGARKARVTERIGSMKSERAVSTIAIHDHRIPHTFSGAILAEAEAARPVDLAGREDWRDIPFITIDPADAKDHDDAVHAEPDPP